MSIQEVQNMRSVVFVPTCSKEQQHCAIHASRHAAWNMQDLLVMYRQTQPTVGKIAKLRQRIVGPNKQESTPTYQQRNSINMRIYRDIPVPSWKIVFPNKLLQFRPLDGLRSDLVSIAGLLCMSI